jgi:hypothetical protein
MGTHCGVGALLLELPLPQPPLSLVAQSATSLGIESVGLVGLIDWSMTFPVHGAGLPDLVEDIRAVVVVVSSGRNRKEGECEGECRLAVARRSFEWPRLGV